MIHIINLNQSWKKERVVICNNKDIYVYVCSKVKSFGKIRKLQVAPEETYFDNFLTLFVRFMNSNVCSISISYFKSVFCKIIKFFFLNRDIGNTISFYWRAFFNSRRTEKSKFLKKGKEKKSENSKFLDYSRK